MGGRKGPHCGGGRSQPLPAGRRGRGRLRQLGSPLTLTVTLRLEGWAPGGSGAAGTGAPSLCLRSLCSPTWSPRLQRPPPGGFSQKGWHAGELGGSKASLETPASLFPPLLPRQDPLCPWAAATEGCGVGLGGDLGLTAGAGLPSRAAQQQSGRSRPPASWATPPQPHV